MENDIELIDVPQPWSDQWQGIPSRFSSNTGSLL